MRLLEEAGIYVLVVSIYPNIPRYIYTNYNKHL